MRERFEGAEGRKLLEQVLNKHRIVGCHDESAKAIAAAVELAEFKPGGKILEQDGSDNDLYFIISGSANVYVNSRHVATRTAYECIGEMAIIEPTAPRAATVTAGTELLAAKLCGAKFEELANRFPNLWRNAAAILSHRLRERAQFHRPPNARPILFVGSTAESVALVREIQLGMKHDSCDVVPWTSGVFGPSKASIESLEQKASQADFAALLLGPDDLVLSRDKLHDAPRDNVLFELGLFMGAIGRERTYLIQEAKAAIKIPSDLLGISPITYVKRDGTAPEVYIGPVCTELSKQIAALGVR